ncbi:MAG: hypothetical protein VX945_01310 [Verrucomicrobiota bacterium]|nr:hypothetical protein [Verrucomicrobiota bacterium]
MGKIDDILGKMLTETREINVDRVPYAFEKRVMAHIKETPQLAVNVWAQWGQSLWRTAIPCFAVMVLVAVWTGSNSTGNQPTQPMAPTLVVQSDPAEEELETIVMLAIDSAGVDQ